MTTDHRDWHDDSAYTDAVQRAERATRFGWTAITATTATLGCALIAAIALCAGAVLAGIYLWMTGLTG
ncbi:hypothetical protein ACFY7C_26335 [Streptomyces sp. NPDC012769]|uniref:hypothetical protein n=1 Tax=Streptomyces sp. NPDC012769 TaxID=3364848 RepID=UPI0036755BB3